MKTDQELIEEYQEWKLMADRFDNLVANLQVKRLKKELIARGLL